MFSAIIADDEPLLRRHLDTLLAEIWPELTIKGQAGNGEQALEQIQSLDPDIVFLDINMPLLSGLEVAEQVYNLANKPLIVFTTAYQEHAIAAFEREAIDYLLKPIESKRLTKAVKRLQKRLELNRREANVDDANIKAVLASLLNKRQDSLTDSAESDDGNDKLTWIRASRSGVVKMIAIAEVDYFLAENKYTSVVVGDEEYLIKTAINKLQQQVDSDVFWRIHRNCLLRVSQIEQVERDFAGHMYVHLKDGVTKLAVSRAYQALFKQM